MPPRSPDQGKSKSAQSARAAPSSAAQPVQFARGFSPAKVDEKSWRLRAAPAKLRADAQVPAPASPVPETLQKRAIAFPRRCADGSTGLLNVRTDLRRRRKQRR